SAFKVFLYIKLPSMLPSLLTATVNALGLAWKSGIAAEVICEPNVGLGTILIEGKGMIDFSSVYAVTLTVVILSLIIEVALKSAARKFVASGRNDV
ncbi:MAG: ABC transporter permease subunit, partial [Clostridia bacterium]|nr:ABC transporter permease subunit [Clostridia bacterium]